MEAKKREQPVYTEQYKSQAVEMVIHSGKSVVQIARELGCSEASLHGWKKRPTTAVVLYLFDLLWSDGRDITQQYGSATT